MKFYWKDMGTVPFKTIDVPQRKRRWYDLTPSQHILLSDIIKSISIVLGTVYIIWLVLQNY